MCPHYWIYKSDVLITGITFLVCDLIWCHVRVVSGMCREQVWAVVTLVVRLFCPLGMIV